MARLEEAIEKKLVEAYKQELKARGITDDGMEITPEDVATAGLGGIFSSFMRIFKKAKAAKKPIKVTKQELVTAMKPTLKKKAEAIAEQIRTITKQSAEAFKAGTLKPIAVPELPVARTIALKQESPCVRSVVREEDVPDVTDWGYEAIPPPIKERGPVMRRSSRGVMGAIVSGLTGVGAPVKGEKDIARGAEAFGLAQAGQADIESGAEAFGVAGLGLDGEDIDTGAEAFGAVTERGSPPRKGYTDPFFTYAETEWDFDMTSPASKPASDPVAVPLAQAAAKQVMAELATTGSVRCANVRLAKQGVVPPPPGKAAKTAGQIAYKAVARGLEKKGIIKTVAGKMAILVAKPPMPESMKVDAKAEKVAAAARLRERQRELVEAQLPKVGFTRFLPVWLRRGMTRVG